MERDDSCLEKGTFEKSRKILREDIRGWALVCVIYSSPL